LPGDSSSVFWIRLTISSFQEIKHFGEENRISSNAGAKFDDNDGVSWDEKHHSSKITEADFSSPKPKIPFLKSME
jgi:hypothetical protein